MVLGDNIFAGHGLKKRLKAAIENAESGRGATVFGYYVDDPERFGIVEFDKNGKAVSIEEKPAKPKSNYCVTGLYFYDNRVVKYAKNLKPSARGELEITDLNRIYLENNATSYQALTPDTAYVMNRLLKNVLYSSVGTAGGRYPNSNGMESFGKTGTASDEKDLWFVGGTPYYVTAVWWGYDAPYDMTKTLGKQQAKTRTCVMAWKALMEQVQADLPYKAFPSSAGVVERRYCTQSGLLAGGSCPSTAVGYYRADDLPAACNYSHAAAPAAPAADAADAAPEQTVIPADTSNLDTE